MPRRPMEGALEDDRRGQKTGEAKAACKGEEDIWEDMHGPNSFVCPLLNGTVRNLRRFWT